MSVIQYGVVMALEARRTWGPECPGENWYSVSMPRLMVTRFSQFGKTNKKSRYLCDFCSNFWKTEVVGGLFCRRVKYRLCPHLPACDFCPGHKKLGIGLSRSSGKNRPDQPPWKQPRFCWVNSPTLLPSGLMVPDCTTTHVPSPLRQGTPGYNPQHPCFVLSTPFPSCDSEPQVARGNPKKAKILPVLKETLNDLLERQII